MGVLRFSYGTMSSGKSTLALQIHHNLSRQSRRGMLLSQLDREGARVSSRLGVSVEAVEVVPGADLFAMARTFADIHGRLDYLVCDEVQFYEIGQVDQLAAVADDLDVDVYAFGLITDFRGLPFDGTRRLLEGAAGFKTVRPAWASPLIGGDAERLPREGCPAGGGFAGCGDFGLGSVASGGRGVGTRLVGDSVR